MSRIYFNIGNIFNSLSGVQPADLLDENFGAWETGTLSIRTEVLAGSYQLLTSDEYSTFLCVPTNNMNITPPASMARNYSFFVSNQFTNKTVTLIGNWTIEGQQVINPVLPGSFGTVTNVRGGLAVYDGSTLSLYPRLFLA